MTIIETATVTSKGQITIPQRVRKLLGLERGTSVAFGFNRRGVMFFPCQLTPVSPYSAREWAAIEKLAAPRSRRRTGTAAKRYLSTL